LRRVDPSQFERRSIGKKINVFWVRESWCRRRSRDWSTRSQQGRRESDQETPASSTKLLSLIVKITGAPMRDMIDWIIGTDETVLDVAIDGLVAILGASFLTSFLHIVIEAL
jgi:hypothetical protein